MDWIFLATAGLLWLAAYGLAQGCALLQQQAPRGLHWHAQRTVGAGHGNNALLATPVALRWILDESWSPANAVGQNGAPAEK